jgi:crotonobetainyl-CoA:carnitine CoA-transferase CaiB-like acyl-CoA transferase
MLTPREILANLWTLTGGHAEALSRVTLTGQEPQLPSTFRVGAAAQVAIAASALAAAELWRLRNGETQSVSVDMRHAVAECRSERYLRVDGQPPPPAWDAIAGVYRTGDGRFVRLHTNFPHHRAAVCRVLGCEADRDSVQAALMTWDGATFEDAVIAAGGVVALMRTRDEWEAHPQGQAVAACPVLTIERIGDAPPRPSAPSSRPLGGMRVLDLSRVIAGPVAGRTLAAHGADVMLIASPDLPSIPWLVIDTGRGKRSAFLDLKSSGGLDAMTALLAETDIFSQGYRPASLGALGLTPQAVASLSPGIVCVSLSAYGATGSWSGRRGFDSLVQTVSGFNDAEGRAAGIDQPKELPAQILDHCAGYLMAYGAMVARARQMREGGSWHVEVSLAQTAQWLWSLGRIDNGLVCRDLSGADIADLTDETPSEFGVLRGIRHAALLSRTPAFWARPPVPLGHDAPRWNS